MIALNNVAKTIESAIAQKTAQFLLKDIRLNANTSLSPLMYENDVPKTLKDYRSNDKKSVQLNCKLAKK